MTQFARLTAAAVVAVSTLSGCAQPSLSRTQTASHFNVDIRRTQDGIPHIKAHDWGSLGYGYGYVQAQDNLCTLADGFVTYRGERSAFFGAAARPPEPAAFGQPSNLDADFFFRFVADDAAVARYRAAQPASLRELIDGFAAGYNRYIDALHTPGSTGAPQANAECAGRPWVGNITADDIYRRLIAANLAGGEARFIPEMVGAQPPRPLSTPPLATIRQATHSIQDASITADSVSAVRAPSTTGTSTPTVTIPEQQFEIAGRRGIGSNGLAFGAASTKDGNSLLFGNPHWFLRGPDRFYQAQLTIPGKLNIAGVSFLGVPMIVIGFNDHVAWTHTVSSARRFGIFQLKLDPADPTRYLYDGVSQPMTAVPITIQTRGVDGKLTPVTRTLYRSRFGPLVDLSKMSPALAWNRHQAFALRDVNVDNLRAFENFLQWDQAHSLDEFIAIEKRLAATPWVNTIAIGKGDKRAWFADLGAVPDVPDTLAAACTTPLGKAFGAKAPGVPFLDGSSSRCSWRHDPTAVQADALPVSSMPSMANTDYVGNFNGSYWLTNAQSPMTGYPKVAGITDTEQSLRTRLGHQIAATLQADGGVSRETLEHTVLDSHSMAAQLFRQPVLDAVCHAGNMSVALKPEQPGGTSQTVDLRPACKVLTAWDGTGNTDSHGANLWDLFWQHLTQAKLERFYRQPFDPKMPLTTPNGIDTSNPALLPVLQQALGQSVLALQRFGFALDSTRGALLYTERNGQRIPLFGGCSGDGYFTVMCSIRPLDAQGYRVDRTGHGESYLQVVSFDAEGVHADTMLSHSESDDPGSAHYADATKRFAAKRWLSFPFTESAIAADMKTTETLQAPR